MPESTPLTKSQIADLLDEIGTLLELRGENKFKCIAFHNASRTIAAYPGELAPLAERGELTTIKGIGKGIAAEIDEMVRSGKSTAHRELMASIPPGLLQMLRLQGLGPKKVRLLHEKLKISDVPSLKKAAEEHRLASLEGFGEKTETNILQAIERLSRHAEKHLYSVGRREADRILEAVRKFPGVLRCEAAGSLRRRKEIIGDIDILAAAKPADAKKIMERFVALDGVESVTGRGETKSSVVLTSGIACDLRVVCTKEYPFALAYFTGSKEHNVRMRSLAKEFGWSLNEYGFTAVPGAKPKKAPPACATEEAIYAAVKLSYVPPELREDMGEIEAAADGAIPELVEESDLRGTFHCHTTESDGTATLQEMAEAARARGWEYLGIADHSQVAAYARGLTPARVKAQHREIDALNASNDGRFRILKGTEVDILADGTLDFDDRTLATFDYVVASIHSKFSMSEAEATKRVVRALTHKHVTMLGHPTGRLLLERDGYPVNMAAVIQAASDHGKIIEINAHPMRLDIDWRWLRLAKEKKVRIAINPDAHATSGLADVAYGVGIARKGWLTKRDVVNTLPLRQLLKSL